MLTSVRPVWKKLLLLGDTTKRFANALFLVNSSTLWKSTMHPPSIFFFIFETSKQNWARNYRYCISYLFVCIIRRRTKYDWIECTFAMCSVVCFTFPHGLHQTNQKHFTHWAQSEWLFSPSVRSTEVKVNRAKLVSRRSVHKIHNTKTVLIVFCAYYYHDYYALCMRNAKYSILSFIFKPFCMP